MDPENGGTQGDAPLVDAPLFDLEAYCSRYRGHTLLQRLHFIARRSSNLRAPAYRKLLSTLRMGRNTAMYQEICSADGAEIRAALGDEFSGVDEAWVAATEDDCGQRLRQMEAELQTFRTNLQKESIRSANNAIGDFHLERGDLYQAQRNYLRTRDYCTTNRHNAEFCLKLIQVCVTLGEYFLVLSYVNKAENTAGMDADARTMAKVSAAAGLSALSERNYRAAADRFLRAAPDLGADFGGVLSLEDCVLYAGLCALATFDRAELKARVVENGDFKAKVEVVPLLRDAVGAFFGGRYQECLAALEGVRPALLLDLHLHAHAEDLLRLIRDKCITQYFSTYVAVRLDRMAGAFGMAQDAMEAAVVEMVAKGRLEARIDLRTNTLRAIEKDARDVNVRQLLDAADTFLRGARGSLLRMACIREGLHADAGRAEGRAEGAQGPPDGPDGPFGTPRGAAGDAQREWDGAPPGEVGEAASPDAMQEAP